MVTRNIDPKVMIAGIVFLEMILKTLFGKWATDCLQQRFNSFKVVVISLAVNIKDSGLAQLAAEITLHFDAGSQLVARCDQQCWVCCHTEAEILRRLADLIHKVKLAGEILCGHRNM